MADPTLFAADPAHQEASGITETRLVRYVLMAAAFAFLGLFLVMPLVLVFVQAFGKGVEFFLSTLAEPDSISAIRLTLIVAGVRNTKLRLAPAHDLPDVAKADLGQLAQDHVLSDLGPPCASGLRFLNRRSDFKFLQVLLANLASSLLAIPRPYRRLRGVEVNEVLIHEAALFVCQRHRHSLPWAAAQDCSFHTVGASAHDLRQLCPKATQVRHTPG